MAGGIFEKVRIHKCERKVSFAVIGKWQFFFSLHHEKENPGYFWGRLPSWSTEEEKVQEQQAPEYPEAGETVLSEYDLWSDSWRSAVR